MSREGDLTILTLSGRLDAVRLGQVRDQLLGLPDQGHSRIITDLSPLDWIDSSGVGLLVMLLRRLQAQQGKMCVASLQRQPKEVFRLLGLDAAFQIFATVDEARAEMTKG